MGDTRQRILDTAQGLFNEAGLARVGVREIARPPLADDRRNHALSL